MVRLGLMGFILVAVVLVGMPQVSAQEMSLVPTGGNAVTTPGPTAQQSLDQVHQETVQALGVADAAKREEAMKQARLKWQEWWEQYGPLVKEAEKTEAGQGESRAVNELLKQVTDIYAMVDASRQLAALQEVKKKLEAWLVAHPPREDNVMGLVHRHIVGVLLYGVTTKITELQRPAPTLLPIIIVK